MTGSGGTSAETEDIQNKIDCFFLVAKLLILSATSLQPIFTLAGTPVLPVPVIYPCVSSVLDPFSVPIPST